MLGWGWGRGTCHSEGSQGVAQSGLAPPGGWVVLEKRDGWSCNIFSSFLVLLLSGAEHWHVGGLVVLVRVRAPRESKPKQSHI